MPNHPNNAFTLTLKFLGALSLLFIFAPMFGMFLDVSGADLFDVAKDKQVQDSIQLTLFAAASGTLFAALFAIPLAYVLARFDFWGKRILQGIIDLPVIIPHSAAGIAILGFVAKDTAVGQFAQFTGLNFIGTPLGIAVAMAYVSIPYLINAARDGFAAVPERLEKAALSLGASHRRTFFSISLPLAKQSVFTGLIMMFARGMSEFGAVIIVAYHPMTTPILIYERFTSFGLANAKAISVLFILVGLLIFITFRIITGTPFLSIKKRLKKHSNHRTEQ